MKKLLLILLCVPLIFSCGDNSTENAGKANPDKVESNKAAVDKDADKVKEWSGDERTWKDVYSQKPVEYLEAIAKGLDPVWDSELKKYTYDDPDAVKNTSGTKDVFNDPQAASSTDTDLPF